MNVKELKERLNNLDDNVEVVVERHGEYCDLNIIDEDELWLLKTTDGKSYFWDFLPQNYHNRAIKVKVIIL